jgi:hypothetical protein
VHVLAIDLTPTPPGKGPTGAGRGRALSRCARHDPTGGRIEEPPQFFRAHTRLGKRQGRGLHLKPTVPANRSVLQPIRALRRDEHDQFERICER